MNSRNPISKWIFLTIVLLFLSLIEFLYLLNSEYLELVKTSETILQGMGINFISALLALIVFFLLFKEFGSPFTKISPKETLVNIYEHYRSIEEWSEFIVNAKEIEVNVVYFNFHFDINEKSYGTFFKNGGKLKLILPNISNENLISEYELMFKEYDADTIKHKIRETERIIDNIFRKNAANNASFEKRSINQEATYFCYNLDNKKILFSIFENIKDGIVNSPCFLINNDKLPQRFDENFWKKEFNYFWENGIK